MPSTLHRTLAAVAVGTATTAVALTGTGTALAAPDAPHDPSSRNSYPTVPGLASLPVPAEPTGVAADASVLLSDVIYAGQT